MPPWIVTSQFGDCDDIHDAASDGARAINSRLTRRGLQLEPASFDAVREMLAAALRLATVQSVCGARGWVSVAFTARAKGSSLDQRGDQFQDP